MNKIMISVLGIVILSFVASIYVSPDMPEVMESHWNSKGDADGTIARFWGLYLLPLISVFVLCLLFFLPNIDPLKKNFKSFRRYYDSFMLVLVLFFFYIHMLVLSWNSGARFNMTQMLMPALGVLFFYLGVLCRHSKRNWMIGIRTPWTLSSDKVWKKTHELGGKLFMATGVIIFLGVFFPKQALWLILVPTVVTVLYTLVYSYLEYKK